MTGPASTPSASALAAWSKSFLADQPSSVRDALLGDSQQVTYPAGALISRDGNYKVILIHRGQIRAKITAWDGREVTTRYWTAGQFSAIPAMLTEGAPSSVEAVTHCEVSVLNPQTFRRLMRTRADLCYQVAVYLAESTYEIVAHLEDNLFNSVQQRVSRHLLEMATPTAKGLLVQTDQTDLAHAIGSVREVVSRALRKLSDAGAIRSTRRQIWIEDLGLLRSFASAGLVTREEDPLRGYDAALPPKSFPTRAR